MKCKKKPLFILVFPTYAILRDNRLAESPYGGKTKRLVAFDRFLPQSDRKWLWTSLMRRTAGIRRIGGGQSHPLIDRFGRQTNVSGTYRRVVLTQAGNAHCGRPTDQGKEVQIGRQQEKQDEATKCHSRRARPVRLRCQHAASIQNTVRAKARPLALQHRVWRVQSQRVHGRSRLFAGRGGAFPVR